jgi:predicted  nucleic acid-binding Zn-ribbon protein
LVGFLQLAVPIAPPEQYKERGMSVDVDQIKNSLKRELEALQGMAQELRLKAALARADLKSELDMLETKLRRAHEDILRIGEHVKAPLHELDSAVRALLVEVRVGFERLRKAFEEQS